MVGGKGMGKRKSGKGGNSHSKVIGVTDSNTDFYFTLKIRYISVTKS